MKKFISKDKRLSFISKLTIIIIWILLAKIVNNEVLLPSISTTYFSLVNILKEPVFFTTIKFTLIRTFLGFFISLFLAMMAGILSSISKIVYKMMDPVLKLLNSIPTIAIIVLALIWLNNEFVPMFVGFIMVFPVLYETILNSILNVEQEIIQMANVYKVENKNIIKDIYLPSILYSLSSILNSVIGINLKMVIAGEVLAQPKYAIGSNLQVQRMYLNTSGVFAWIVIIILISTVLNYIGKTMKYSLGTKRWK